MRKHIISLVVSVVTICGIAFNYDYFEKLLTQISDAAMELVDDGTGAAVEELESELDDLKAEKFFIIEETESTQEETDESGSNTIRYKEIRSFSAEEANQWFADNVNPDYIPPYKPETIVKEIELTEKTTFVRVYDNMPGGSSMYGSWMMQADDIFGLTPLEIQDKFALPNTPKYVCDVELEAGTHIRVGEVNPIDGWGKGGGIQYDLIGQKIGVFKNERILEVK